MEVMLRFSRDAARHLLVVLLGFLFALALYKVWTLEARWVAVTAVAIALVSFAMCFAAIFADFLITAFFFILPLCSFNKWFWPDNHGADELGNLVYGGMVGIGLIDFLLIALYGTWFYRIFIIRSQEMPGIKGIDIYILLFIGLHLLSTLGAADVPLGLHATEYLAKHILLYFYLSRNLRPAHMPWLITAFCSAILMEGALGLYQHFTGKLLGIALDKGAGSSSLDYQYVVPGLESKIRATGTSYDSHSLGNFIGMLLPFPLVLFLTPHMKGGLRFIFAVLAILAIFVLILSFSRSAWLGSAIALAIGIMLILIVWQESQVVPPMIIAVVLVVLSLPWTASYVYDRFYNSPIGTLTTRFDQYEVALSILSAHPIFGVGPGNYMEALKHYDFLWLEKLPVHNVILWIATETGILGVLSYLGFVLSALWRLAAEFSARRDITGRLAMAAFIALVGYLLDGLTDPLFREPNVFAMFWLLISLAVAFTNFPKIEETEEVALIST